MPTIKSVIPYLNSKCMIRKTISKYATRFIATKSNKITIKLFFIFLQE